MSVPYPADVVIRNDVSRAIGELRAAGAALLGVEAYARRVLVELEASPIPAEPNPALDALRTIEAHCRSARAEITTVDLIPTKGAEPA